MTARLPAPTFCPVDFGKNWNGRRPVTSCHLFSGDCCSGFMRELVLAAVLLLVSSTAPLPFYQKLLPADYRVEVD